MNPFDCKSKARAVILSYKAHEKLIELIESLGIKIVFSKPCGADERIADHPDLQIHPIDGKTFVASSDTCDYYKEQLEEYGTEVICGESSVGQKYPEDCRYNVARVGNYYISRKNTVDEKLERIFHERGLSPIFQKQGYAKCMSICFEDFVITNDRSIEKALVEEGIEVYYISEKGIRLDGYNIGFLGGSCGIIDNMKIMFSGRLSDLEDYKKLRVILDEKGIEIVYPDCDLVDLGSIIPII